MPKAQPASVQTTRRRYGTLAEAAELLGCHERTIRRRVADGSLTAYKFGPRLLRVDLDEVDALLEPLPTVGTVA